MSLIKFLFYLKSFFFKYYFKNENSYEFSVYYGHIDGFSLNYRVNWLQKLILTKCIENSEKKINSNLFQHGFEL